MPSVKPDPKDVEKTKAVAAIGYIWILFLIPMLTEKESQYAKFHARQGMILFIAWVIIWVIGMIPVLGWIVAFFGSIALAILSIVGFLKALQGEMWELPVLGEYAKRFNI